MKKTVLFLFILACISVHAQIPHPLGHGVRTTGEIYCFAYDSVNNRLYAGGAFENIGGVETPNIACFDGTQWHAMNAGLPGVVTCMKMLNGNLYVGGSFSKTGSVALNNIAMWDGINWSAVGNTVVTTYIVRSLEIYKNELYLSAFLAMGIGETGVVKWNGNNWTLIAKTNTTNATIKLLSANDTLYLYGGFQTLNGVVDSNFAAYDGVNFYDYSIPTFVSSVAYNNHTVYAASSAYYYHYANNTWIQDAQSTNASAFLFTYNDSLYATFMNNGSDTLEIWNFNNGIKVKKCGSTIYPSNSTINFNASIEANSKVYIGGLFYFNLGGKQIVTSASYDGLIWNQFAGAALTYVDAWLNASINTMVRDTLTGDIYAGGSFLFAGDSISFNLARWDGTQWHPMGKGFSSTVYKLIFYNNTLFACGSFKLSGATVVNSIAKWDGSNWLAVGSGSSGSLYDMEVFNNELYVAGNFTTFNGLNSNYIVKYNGSTWSSVGSNNLDSRVLRLTTYNNQLVAGAYFYFLNLSSNVVKLNGSAWAAMPSTQGNSLSDLVTFNGSLYVADNNDVYKLSMSNTWLATGISNQWNERCTFNIINGKLVTTISNDGMYMLDTIWKPFQYFIQANAVVQLNSSDYAIGGFFPYYFDGLNDIYLYNAAILQIKKPDVAIITNGDTICSHQYVFFNTISSTFPTTYEWQFPGGIPSTSNLQSPIVKYNVPGSYDVYIKVTNDYGTDSIFAPLKIQVNTCTVGIDEKELSNDILIYPNPSNDVVHVFSESKIESVQLVDCFGKCLFNNSGNQANQVDFNVSNYAKGIYFLMIQSSDRLITKKFIRN